MSDQSWRWATVAQVAPVLVRFDKETSLHAPVDVLCDVAVGDRVRCHTYGAALIVMANANLDPRTGGSLFRSNATYSIPHAMFSPPTSVQHLAQVYNGLGLVAGGNGWVVQTAGVYLVTAGVSWAVSTAGLRFLYLYAGAEYTYSFANPVAAQPTNHMATLGPIPLESGIVVKCAVAQTSGDALSTVSDLANYLSVTRVS